MLFQDIRHSVRLLRRTPGFTAVAVLVLALGIGANTAVFSLVNALVLQPRPGRIDTLVNVYSRDRIKPAQYRDFSYGAYTDLRDRSGVFESLMAHTFSLVGIGDGAATKQSFAAVVSASYFTTLGVPLAAGRPFTAEEERPGARTAVAIASYAVWREAGFSPAFIGSTVRVNGTPFTIVGVTPRGFAGTMAIVSPQWWFPLGTFDVVVNDMFRMRATGLADRGNYTLNLAGMLKPGVTRAAAEQALDAFAKRLDSEYPGSDKDQTYIVGGLPRMSVSTRPETDNTLPVFSALLTLMAALVLVVACLNLANLLLARGVARRREIAIRQALGSGRRRVIQQLLIEGLTLSAMGALCGAVVGWWATRALSAWLGSALPLGIEVVIEPSSWRLPLAALGLAVFSTVFFALGPSWALSRPAVASDLKEDAAHIRRRSGTGGFLVVGQLAVSLALVAAGGLFVRAAINAASADPGFSLQHQLIFSIDPSLAGYTDVRSRSMYRSALERVRAVAGVERASVASIVPFGEFREGRTVRLTPGADGVGADFLIVGSDYFDTIGLRLLRGREFTRAEEDPVGATAAPAAGAPVVIDRLLSKKLFSDADPLGQRVLIQRREGEAPQSFVVIGVVAEMRHDIFEVDARPHAYGAFGGMFRPSMTIHARTRPGFADAAMLAAIRAELLRHDERLPIIAAKTMVQHRDRSLTEWAVRAAATLFSAFGALALLLATIGVYGLRAYDVSRRTRELGIRMALGATSGDVERLVMREGLRSTVVGVTIGLLLAAGLGKLVSGMLYRVSPFDPLVMAAAAAVLSAAAMVACYVPARRATRIAPLEALRSE
jgi:putative ABC transport system permease protein